MRSTEPLGKLLRNGRPFYFRAKSNGWPDDYVYEDGISLTVMDYRDALSVLCGVRPGEYAERRKK